MGLADGLPLARSRVVYDVGQLTKEERSCDRLGDVTLETQPPDDLGYVNVLSRPRQFESSFNRICVRFHTETLHGSHEGRLSIRRPVEFCAE